MTRIKGTTIVNGTGSQDSFIIWFASCYSANDNKFEYTTTSNPTTQPVTLSERITGAFRALFGRAAA